MFPETRGVPVSKTEYVYASYADNKVTRLGHTGFIVLLNKAPIIWYSKRHNTMEASTFSSEFIATKDGVENIKALRFKLCMLGIPFVDSTNILRYNSIVVNNSSILYSILN